MNVKICSKCKETKIVSEFHKCNSAKTGYASQCKKCALITVTISREKHPEASRNATRRYRERHPEKVKEYRNGVYKASKAYHAHAIVNNAIQSGAIIRPDKCQRCDSNGELEAHHPDYDNPLSVEWLCIKCHGLIKRKDACNA